MLLAMDTATRMTGVALHDGSRVLAETIWRGGGRQTVELAPQVALLLQRSGVSPADLSAVAVALGPGSYTGLRIGMALAKGLALSHSLQLVGIPTLDILAYAQPPGKDWMAVLIEAGRGRFVLGWYKHTQGTWRSRGEPETVSWPQARVQLQEAVYVCGELDPEQRETLRKETSAQLAPPAACVRRPAVLADMAWSLVREGKLSKPDALVPTYLGRLHGKRT